MSLPKLITAMLNPELYPHAVNKVELIQTHISYVLLAGSYVYKIKKPVELGFLDFSTLDKRQVMCREEVRLNRRLAPDVYLDVVPIYEGGPCGVTLTPSSGEQPVEYAVKMRRLSEDTMLPSLLQANDVPRELLAALGHRLADFHDSAPPASPELTQDAYELVRRNFEENFAQTEELIGPQLDKARLKTIQAYAVWFLGSNRALFEQRVAKNRIRECHGDLRMEHVCIEEDSIIIFDCIEFNTRFRCIDTAEDLAFLLMDMEFNSYWDEAALLLESYQDKARDSDMPALLTFFKCYYAMTRSKVFAIKSAEEEFSQEEQSQALNTALAYFNLAYAYAVRVEQPVLIIMCGLTGSGKSSLAEVMASRITAKIFKSDAIRKDLAGIDRTEHHEAPFGQGLYTQDWTEKTYASLLEKGACELRDGQPVLLDASFLKRKHRLQARQTADKLQAHLVCVQCLCPREVVRKRMVQREQVSGVASDGRWDVYQGQESLFEPLTDMDESSLIQVRTDEPVSRCAETAVQALLEKIRS